MCMLETINFTLTFQLCTGGNSLYLIILKNDLHHCYMIACVCFIQIQPYDVTHAFFMSFYSSLILRSELVMESSFCQTNEEDAFL